MGVWGKRQLGKSRGSPHWRREWGKGYFDPTGPLARSEDIFGCHSSGDDTGIQGCRLGLLLNILLFVLQQRTLQAKMLV